MKIPQSKINFSILKQKMNINDINISPYKLPLNKTLKT